MDVILHVGAHRTGATSFHSYMAGQAETLRSHGVAFWGAKRLRGGLFADLLPTPRAGAEQAARAVGRVRLNCAGLARRGNRNLIVSDAEMLGSLRGTLHHTRLYLGAGERLARVNAAFDGQIGTVFVTIRSLDRFWASGLATALAGGAPVPTAATLDRIVTQPRSWREVIADIACALPGAQVLVLPFEQIAGRPHHHLEYMTGGRFQAPQEGASCWLGRAPRLPELRKLLRDRGTDPAILGDGEDRWSPFDAGQTAALKETYADDLFWLRSGADGLALLIEERAPDMAGQLPGDAMTRGRHHDDERAMAGARRKGTARQATR